jgi:hypothetical protein
MNRKLRDDLEHLTYRVGHLEDQNA